MHCAQISPIKKHFIARIISVCINIFQRHTWNSWIYYKGKLNNLSEPQTFYKIPVNHLPHDQTLSFEFQTTICRRQMILSGVWGKQRFFWFFLPNMGHYQPRRSNLVIAVAFQRSWLDFSILAVWCRKYLSCKIQSGPYKGWSSFLWFCNFSKPLIAIYYNFLRIQS